MAILAGDIKLVASQVMSDIDEGGGGPTSTVIVDGASNSLFPDISELDRAGGRVNLRKVFANVQTNNADTYLGSNVIVADGPDDPNVSVTIFKATGTFDQRTDAQNRMESYLNKGPLWGGYLLENHITGQRAIQIFQRETADLPTVGTTMYLVMNEGAGNEFYQYVRLTDVSSEVRTFSYSVSGGYVDYTARVVTCSLSDALRYDFAGSAPDRMFVAASGKTKLRSTIVADAAKYYGVVKSDQPVAIGDVSVSVDSIFTNLVPSAQSETPLVDKNMTPAMLPMVATRATTITRSVTASISPSGKYVTPTGVYPGSLSLTIGATVITDNSVGTVFNGTTEIGTINYATGEIAFSAAAPTVSGSCSETYRPATGVSQQSYSLSRQVTQASRAYNWIFPLSPVPAPGSAVVSYMAQGNWYELRDNGNGTLTGSDTSYGVGTISYVTGTVSVTLGALPDIATDITVAWGTPQEFVYATDSVFQIAEPRIDFDLGEAVAPGALTITWVTGGVTKTATDNGTGQITGDATGEIYYGSGEGWIRANPLPDIATINITYSTGGAHVYGTTVAEGTSWTGTLPNGPVKPKSVVMSLLIDNLYDNGEGGVTSYTAPAIVRDDGAGGLLLDGTTPLAGSSINYTTGAVVLPVNIASSVPVPTYIKVPAHVIKAENY